MTELLHREKEFREINERLNKMAQPQSNSNSNAPTSPRTNKNVTKFTARAADASRTAATGRLNGGTTLNGTYTKLKGPTHLLKKQQGGAGDGTVDTIPTIPPLHPPTRKPTDTYTKVAKNNAGDKRESKFGNALRKNVRDSPRGGANNDGAGNGADNRDSNTTTRRNNNAANSQNRTFVMRYRNPNFVESPSLEMIVRDELSSLEMERLSTEFQQSSSREQQADQQASNISMQLDAMTNGIKRSEYKIAAGDRRKFSTDGLIKFLKSKVTILEEQHGSLSREMTKQKEVLDKALERTKVLEQQRDQAYAKNNSLSEQLHKVETQLEEANTRVKERVQTQLQQQKDIEELKRELKMVTQSNANLEKRLFRAQEELENSKTTITSMKNAEREFKESVRVEAENKEKQLKNLKKLRGDLFNAYKKQLYLIDNLSRQNICLEQAAMVGITEKEFNKVLDWNGGAENATDPKSSPNH